VRICRCYGSISAMVRDKVKIKVRITVRERVRPCLGIGLCDG